MKLSGEYYRALVGGNAGGPWGACQRGVLRALSVPYRWASSARNWCYDRGWLPTCRVPLPVVSVGNLTLGGTGKTPCVEYVARFYIGLGHRPGILSRGYGRRGAANDEAMLLGENLPGVPHWQGHDRVDLAQEAVASAGVDVLIMDDGFQHRRLARDLDLVLLDATNTWGHGYVFPRGLLREAKENLRRANIVVLTRCNMVEEKERGRLREEVVRMVPGVPVVETVHRPLGFVNGRGDRADLGSLRPRKVAAFCGIGNPQAFRATLAELGAAPVDFRIFPDHHPYPRADIAHLHDWGRQLGSDCTLLTTQKDLVKLRLDGLGGRPLWALRVGLHVESGRDVLDRGLRQAVEGRGPGPETFTNQEAE